MTPVMPAVPHQGARLIILGKNRSDVQPMLAAIDDDGVVMTEWLFSAVELAPILDGGRLRLWTFTDGAPWQPVVLEVVE